MKIVAKLLILDMEGVLVDGEYLSELAKVAGNYDAVEEIAKRGIEGKIDWKHGLKERISLLTGMKYEDCLRVANNMKLVKGAKEFVDEVKDLGIKVGVITGGFEILANKIKRQLGLDFAIANKLVFKHNTLAGVEMRVSDDNKHEHLMKIAKELGVALENVVAVGDGANDLRMLRTAGLGIGFNATEVVRRNVKVVVDADDLRALLPFIRVFLVRGKRLMMPGPTPINERIMRAMATQVVSHRSAAFRELLSNSVKLIKKIFNLSEYDIVIMTGSSTLGMEATIKNFLRKGEKVLTLVNGEFGERFAKIVQTVGAIPIRVGSWCEEFDMKEVESAMKRRDVKLVTLVHNETSTGMVNPTEKIVKLAKKYGKVTVVDFVSAIGGDEVDIQGIGVDIAILGVQKAVGAPPGLVVLAIRKDAWKHITDHRGFYTDLLLYKQYAERGQTPFTPAINLLYGLNEALKIIEQEGVENRAKRHELFRNVVRRSLKKFGFKLLVREEAASPTLTAAKPPEGFEVEEIIKRLREFGVVISNGQGKLKDKIIRIAHMGNVTKDDVLDTIAALEMITGGTGKVTADAFKILNNYPIVLIPDDLPESVISQIEKIAIVETKIDDESLAEANILIVRSRTKVTEELLRKMKNLKLIIRAGHGIDNIDVEAARALGITVETTAGSTEAVAELTIALILNLLRKIIIADKGLKSGKWMKGNLVGKELKGKTIGIIGLGRIGRRVAELAQAFGANVIAFDPYVKQAEVRKVSMEELLKTADIITLHVPLTKETAGLIGEEEFSMMKDGVIFVNTSRAQVVEKKAFLKALNDGKFGGVAVDVFMNEPIIERELVDTEFENFIITPHIGAQTVETKERIGARLTELVRRFKENQEGVACIKNSLKN
ncbi:MAG: phosphoserine phosphatase SerB [Thaumarchaeota archaeon]|nr:phosphoserine phosphatase SerB [Nitrososphaerota archaeon]